jgi:TolB-like protein
MAGEIFISYRRADEVWARLLHSQLRAEGVEAWYDAHIGAGQDWRITTANALQASRIFVLLFSQSASESEDVAKELAAAIFSKKLVVPVRIENIQPTGAFLYELASRNWVNAFENTEVKLAELAQSLARLVKAGIADESILPFDRNAGAKPSPRKRLSRPAILAGAAVIIIAATALSHYSYVHPPVPAAANAPAAAVASLPPKAAGASVAVLPFVNLSGDPKQEFFSDGITEEITSALAKVPGLVVIGRTSAFQFKSENRDMRAIGKALGVSNLIEGSVRKDGNKVRITAQLIKAADGTHLWTESYDRELKSIFAVQEEIATAIAGAMQVPLGLKQGQSLVSNRTENTESYQDFLRAQALFRARRNGETVSLLKGVLARDPNYAPGWALLAKSYGSPGGYAPLQDAVSTNRPDEARKFLQSQLRAMEQAARKAISLDPNNAEAYAALGTYESLQGNWAASEDYTRKALALDPNNSDTLYSYGYNLAATGKVKEAMRVQNQIMALEPFVPVYRGRGADLLWALGKNDAALALEKTADQGSTTNIRLAKIYASKGQYAQAADLLLAAKTTSLFERQSLDTAAHLMRSAPAKATAPDSLPLVRGDLSFVYLFIGAEGRSLDFVEQEIAIGYFGGIFRDPWAPASAALRKTERFKAFVRKARLVEYWRARGWPEYCHPAGAEDFSCH